MTTEPRLLTLKVQERRLDASVAAPFREAVMTEVERHQATAVSLDMSIVDFVDSSGLGALVSILKAVGGATKMQLMNVQPAVQSMLRLTRMDQVFKVHAATPTNQ